MLKLKLKSDILNELIEALHTLTAEARIHVGPNGIYTNVVDPANMAMVYIELKKEAFEHYEVPDEFTGDTEGNLGCDINKIRNILEMAEKDTDIGLELDATNLKLVLKLGKGLEFKVNLLSPGSLRKDPREINVDYPAHVILKGEDLWRGIKAAESIHDYCYIGTTQEGGFFIEAEADTDTIRYELTKDKQIQYATAQTKSMFAVEYIRDISRFANKKEEIEVDLKTDFPITIRFKIAGGNGSIRYMVAPRVESV